MRLRLKHWEGGFWVKLGKINRLVKGGLGYHYERMYDFDESLNLCSCSSCHIVLPHAILILQFEMVNLRFKGFKSLF